MGNNSSAVATKADEKTHTPASSSSPVVQSPVNMQKKVNGNGNVDASDDDEEGSHKKSVKVTRPPAKILGFELNDETRQMMKHYRTPIATSLASVTSTLVAYPLDFVKARMQSYNTAFVPTLLEAYRHEGIRGMYRGCITPIYTIALVRTISFSTYQDVKYRYDRFSQSAFGVSPLDMANAKGQYPNIHTITCFALSGCAAGAVIPIFAAPFELLKLKSQLAGKMARDGPSAASIRTMPTSDIKTGTWGPAYQMYKDHGWTSLWRGGSLHLARDTLGTAIYFSTYEAVKQTLANAQGHDPTNPRASAVAGGLCGMMSWIFIYPIDVVKTQYQKRFLSNEQQKAGRVEFNFLNRAGYRGLLVSIARSGIINALFFPMFERYKRTINGL